MDSDCGLDTTWRHRCRGGRSAWRADGLVAATEAHLQLQRGRCTLRVSMACLSPVAAEAAPTTARGAPV